jgi:serine/threonine protein kinase
MDSSSHPNVVSILDCYLVQDAKKFEVWVALQFLEYGALTETLTMLTMKEPEIAYVCKNLTEALRYLHSRNFLHRDIKSDNVLLGATGEVKLADFGLAIELVKGAEKRRSVLGTPFWMSPEVINGKDYDDRVDVWALGVTAIEMMTKNPPYSTYPKTKALFLITSQGIPLSHFANQKQWSKAMKDWLGLCLTFDGALRPHIFKLKDHLFMKNAASQEEFVKNCIVPMKGKIKQQCSVM